MQLIPLYVTAAVDMLQFWCWGVAGVYWVCVHIGLCDWLAVHDALHHLLGYAALAAIAPGYAAMMRAAHCPADVVDNCCTSQSHC